MHLIFTLIISLGFLNYLFDLRKTGPEAEGIIWWNKLRPIVEYISTFHLCLQKFCMDNITC